MMKRLRGQSILEYLVVGTMILIGLLAIGFTAFRNSIVNIGVSAQGHVDRGTKSINSIQIR